MRRSALRREPVISFGPGPRTPAPAASRIARAPRSVLTGDLTRSIRRRQALEMLEPVRRALSLSDRTFEAVAAELLSGDGPLLGEESLGRAMRALFDCEPIAPTTPHPIVLVGGAQPARLRVALALAQRMEWAGRRVALCSLQAGRFAEPETASQGGLAVATVGSVGDCIAAARGREPYEMAIVEASCLDGAAEDANTLPKLALGLDAETIYVDDGASALPDFDDLPGIERLILSGRPGRDRFGAMLDAAYRHGYAFAGQCRGRGIYHPMTPAMLADRFGLAVR